MGSELQTLYGGLTCDCFALVKKAGFPVQVPNRGLHNHLLKLRVQHLMSRYSQRGIGTAPPLEESYETFKQTVTIFHPFIGTI